MNHIYLISLVVLKCPGFQSKKYGMPNYAQMKRRAEDREEWRRDVMRDLPQGNLPWWWWWWYEKRPKPPRADVNRLVNLIFDSLIVTLIMQWLGQSTWNQFKILVRFTCRNRPPNLVNHKIAPTTHKIAPQGTISPTLKTTGLTCR